MRDWLDDALEDLAREEAPPDFARRVRVQLEAGGSAPSLWPRLAAAVGALLLIVGGTWMVTSDYRKGGAPVGGAEAPPAQVTNPGVPVHPDVRAGGTSVPPTRDTRAGGTSVRAGGTSVPPTSDSVSPPDHDRALPALAQLDTVGPESLVSVPMTVDAREVGALTAIAPIEIPALGADQGESRWR